MTSVRHTNGDYLSSSTLPTMSGAFTICWWLKCNSGEYGNAGEHIPVGLGTTGGSSEGLLVDVGFTNNTTLTALAFRSGGSDLQSVDVLTGSDTGWICCAWRHAASSASYDFSYRREGETTWTTNTLTLGAALAAVGGSAFVGTDQFNEHAQDSDTRHYFVQETRLSDATLLTATQTISGAPAGTNLHYLDLDSATNAEVNGGTAGNWTVTGTLQTDSTEPSEAAASVYNLVDINRKNLFHGFLPHLRMK